MKPAGTTTQTTGNHGTTVKKMNEDEKQKVERRANSPKLIMKNHLSTVAA